MDLIFPKDVYTKHTIANYTPYSYLHTFQCYIPFYLLHHINKHKQRWSEDYPFF